MSWLSKTIRKANKFVAKIDPVTKNSPEFQMVKDAFETGNWTKPYGEEKSAWDVLGAGPGAQITNKGKPILGQLDPDDPGKGGRATGRLIGTAIANYWTFGAFSKLIRPGAPGSEENPIPYDPETGNTIANPMPGDYLAPSYFGDDYSTTGSEFSLQDYQPFIVIGVLLLVLILLSRTLGKG